MKPSLIIQSLILGSYFSGFVNNCLASSPMEDSVICAPEDMKNFSASNRLISEDTPENKLGSSDSEDNCSIINLMETPFVGGDELQRFFEHIHKVPEDKITK